jgi:hypothetical protein
MGPALQEEVAECVNEMLANVDEVGALIRRGEMPLY